MHVYLVDREVEKKERCTGRAVFTATQKNWLEYYFQMEKYITKQNRKTLASSLGLTDLQVSVLIGIYIFIPTFTLTKFHTIKPYIIIFFLT